MVLEVEDDEKGCEVSQGRWTVVEVGVKLNRWLWSLIGRRREVIYGNNSNILLIAE